MCYEKMKQGENGRKMYYGKLLPLILQPPLKDVTAHAPCSIN